MASSRPSFSARPLQAALLQMIVLLVAAAAAPAANAQTVRQRSVPRSPTANANANLNPAASRNPNAATPAVLVRCFAANCAKCNAFNPYVCAQCTPGYQLSAALSCNSCAPGYEQNLDVQTFTCTACPSGFFSNGGTGLASQCYKLTTTGGRRLFEKTDVDDLWA